MNAQTTKARLLERIQMAGRRIPGTLRDIFTVPASAMPLAVFRIGIAAVLLLQALAIAGNVQELFGPKAIVQWSALRGAGGGVGYHPGIPGINDVVAWLAPFGVTASGSVQGVFLVYVAAMACLLIGWRSRISGGIAWITHLMLCSSGYMTIYGVDQFANIALFYTMVMPAGAVLSLDHAAGRTSAAPTITNRIALCVLQLHLCIAYFASGVHKASGVQWWNGEAIWRALTLPELAQFDMTWLASVPWLAMLLCWGTLFVEVGYPFLILPQKTRRFMACATIGLHAGIAVFMGLVSFSAVMSVLTFSAFVISGDPARATLRSARGSAGMQPLGVAGGAATTSTC